MSDKLKVVSIRLVEEPPWYGKDPVNHPAAVADLVSEELKNYDRELLVVINLTTKMHPICLNIVSIGTLDTSLAHPREIFKSAILCNAAHIILAHNHPSGLPLPSKADIKITKKIEACGELLGITVLDHLIVGKEGDYMSIKGMEEDMIPPAALEMETIKKLEQEGKLQKKGKAMS